VTLRVLISFAAWTPSTERHLADAASRVRLDWVLDSGAFTAHSKGQPITVEQYGKFLQALHARRDVPHPSRYMTLDVIGNPKGTLTNYAALRKMGFKPEPIFTRGAPLEQLDAYLETADRVAIGNLGNRKSRLGYLKYLFSQRRALAQRSHLLGVTELDSLLWWKPASVDSSSWATPLRYGTVSILLNDGRLVNYGRGDMHRLVQSKRRDEIEQALRNRGSTLAEAMVEANWKAHYKTAWRTRVTVRSWLTYCKIVAHTTGTDIYLAVTNIESLAILVEEYAGLNPTEKVAA